MTNEEAIDDLKNFRTGLGAGCRLPMGERGLEIQRTHIHAISQAIKSLEVVEKIKKAYSANKEIEEIDDAMCFANATYNILCEAYGSNADCESWVDEYRELPDMPIRIDRGE